jgi:hypothetical protein
LRISFVLPVFTTTSSPGFSCVKNFASRNIL